MNKHLTILMSLLLLGTLGCRQATIEAGEPETPERLPTALAEGITVEPFMQIGRGGIRLCLDPISGDFFYNNMRGDIYRIYRQADSLYDEKLYDVKDHGIESLQGMYFLDSSLYLVGNKFYQDNKATKGIVMRGQLAQEGKYKWDTLAITEAYGKPKTLYSHEFNGIALSPDQQFIYINSGARTDHGEVQDNDGLFPGLRESNLTACILRLPVNGKNVLLRDDSTFLAEEGYLFAAGIRNAYDLDFSPKGHLFAVSNSSDYDHPEDMFWVREGHHYGFPWRMGNMDNPQQYADWEADPEKDPFINTRTHAYTHRYFRNDPDFPKKPATLNITPPVLNYGPDANFYRERETGEVKDGDDTGEAVGTFTAHRSPLGLFFDQDSLLAPPYTGEGFVLSYTFGEYSSLMRPISTLGGDLMHLKLQYDPETDNYTVNCYRIVEGFRGPTDALMIENDVYVIETSGMIWKIRLPVHLQT
ncbi:cytochrome c class I [Porifericola rhodea]|uniref:cytochrome c class I n=1 Tax=Porifericola rhodea TaxID=930972 RepID=UPI0026660B80|nr:cytochrome c class I [Porifericola rhodea]WKN32667.1 cytochrome c class I [Porifericola rhodea]